MAETAIVLCVHCGTPMRVDFGTDGEIDKVFAVCKCPREPVAERSDPVGLSNGGTE